MKKILALILILVSVFSVSGCAAQDNTDNNSQTAESAESTVLNFYNWGEYISDGKNDLIDTIEEFEKKFNVKVNKNYFNSNEEMYAKLISGSAEFDVMIPSEYMITRLIEEDRLEEINFENVPNYEYIDDNYKGSKWGYDPENKYSVPYTWGLVGLAYNSKKVKGTIDSWNALWDEAYKDNIYMLLNPRDSFGIAQKKLGFSLNSTSVDELNKAAEELKKQRPLVAAYVMDDMTDRMIGNEAILTPCYAGDGVTMMDENPDIKVTFPKEGTNIFVDAMVIPKGAKNKELAEKFINFMNEPEVALNNILCIQYSTPHKEAYKMLPDSVKDNKIIYPDQATLDKAESFKHLPVDFLKQMDEIWIDIKNSVY